jgi:hypothetical protein
LSGNGGRDNKRIVLIYVSDVYSHTNCCRGVVVGNRRQAIIQLRYLKNVFVKEYYMKEYSLVEKIGGLGIRRLQEAWVIDFTELKTFEKFSSLYLATHIVWFFSRSFIYLFIFAVLGLNSGLSP